MRKQVLFILLAIVSIGTSKAQDTLKVNLNTSGVKWSGEYTFYFGGHHGTIPFREGYLIQENRLFSGGAFVMDMNRIICDDLAKDDGNADLVKHLKSNDFFDVETFPTAQLMIVDIVYKDDTNIEITADLTIRGITKPITFSAKIDHEKNLIMAKFKIDRRQWEVSYSSKFKDGAISDGIGFEIKLHFID